MDMTTVTERPLIRYRVSYLRRQPGSRVYHLLVNARNPDEAREYAAIRDPLYGSSLEVKHRGTIVPAEPCYICKRPITDDLYTRIDFRGRVGIQLVCDICLEKADDGR
jgi:hypothetical protein